MEKPVAISESTSTPVIEHNFLESFTKSFELFSYNNQRFGQLCAHVLLGQILKNIKIYFGPIYIDPRISLFFIQPSGTGKSTPWTFIKEVGTKCGLQLDDIDEATDAALVGTTEAVEEIDPETRAKTIKHEIVEGKLAHADILHYDEGQMLIKRGQYSQNSLAWFQKALNPIGSGQNICTKNLAHGEISFAPTCSLLITSHEIEDLLETVLNTGFFQRIALYPRYVPINERLYNELLRCDRFGKQMCSELDVETLAAKLLRTQEANKEFVLKVNPNVYPVAKQHVSALYRLIDNTHERVREIMATFVPRYNNLMYIFAVHHCCVEMKKELDISDIKYASALSTELFKVVMVWVEENITLQKLNSKEQAYYTYAVQIYRGMEKDENGFVYLAAFIKNFSEKWRISPQSIQRNLDKFAGMGKVKSFDKANIKMIKVII